MGVMYDYFIASDDAEAASVLDLDLGPGGPLPAPPMPIPELIATYGVERAMAMLGRVEVRTGPTGIRTLSTKGISPSSDLGKLEEVLTGVGEVDIQAGTRFCVVVAVADDGERTVETITDELRDGLAVADAARMAAVVPAWLDRLGASDEAEGLVAFAAEFAALAREAASTGQRLYCWTSL
jgi:hypothetical protein